MNTIEPAKFPVINQNTIKFPNKLNEQQYDREAVNPNFAPKKFGKLAPNTLPKIKNAGEKLEELVAEKAVNKSEENTLTFYHPNKNKIQQPTKLGHLIDIKI